MQSDIRWYFKKKDWRLHENDILLFFSISWFSFYCCWWRHSNDKWFSFCCCCVFLKYSLHGCTWIGFPHRAFTCFQFNLQLFLAEEGLSAHRILACVRKNYCVPPNLLLDSFLSLPLKKTFSCSLSFIPTWSYVGRIWLILNSYLVCCLPLSLTGSTRLDLTSKNSLLFFNGTYAHMWKKLFDQDRR